MMICLQQVNLNLAHEVPFGFYVLYKRVGSGCDRHEKGSFPQCLQETVYGWWPITYVIAFMGAMLGTLAPTFKAIKQEVIEALAHGCGCPIRPRTQTHTTGRSVSRA